MNELTLRDEIIRQSLQILRMSAGSQAEADAQLQQLSKDLERLLQTQSLSEASKAQIRGLIAEANIAIKAQYGVAAQVVDTQALAIVIAEKTAAALETIGVSLMPSAERLASLTKDVLIEGAPSSAWWSKQAEDTAFKFAAQVRQGVINGETNERIVQRIVGKRGEPGIMDVARRNARSLVHSSVMNAASNARMETYRKNKRFMKGVEWLATLDMNSCAQCAALDGSAWDFDGKPIQGTKIEFRLPLAHWNCRCVVSPIPKNTLGLDFGPDTRASSLGPITGDTSFDAYLKRLSPAQVEEQFGKGRAALLLKGTITVKDLVSGTGRELSLDQLQALN